MTTPRLAPVRAASASGRLLLLAGALAVASSVLAQAPTDTAPAAPPPAAASAPAAAPAPPMQVTPARLRQELHRADRFLLEGRHDEALASLALVTSVQPRHAGAQLMTSKALLGAGRTADARDAARRAVELLEGEPADRRAAWLPAAFYLQLGRSCAATGDMACAVTSLRRADREQPGTGEILRDLGSAHLRLGEDAEAAEVLRRAVQADPSSARAHLELGNALLRLSDPAAAEASFRKAAELAPEEPEPHFGLSSAAGARGDDAAREAALTTYEELSRRRDERVEAARRVGEALHAAGEHQRAERHAEAAAAYAALLEDPFVASDGWKRDLILLDLGRMQARSGEQAAAVATLRRAVAEAPSSGAAQLELGNLLASQGLVDEAFPHLLRAAELDPLQPGPHVSLAMAWAALGRLDEALAESARASLLAPEDLALRRQYVELLAASGRVDEARALAQRGGLPVAPPAETAAAPEDGTAAGPGR